MYIVREALIGKYIRIFFIKEKEWKGKGNKN